MVRDVLIASGAPVAPLIQMSKLRPPSRHPWWNRVRGDHVEHLAAAMDPGSVAGVLVYENLWAAPFASAMRRAGGQLIANGRIPIQALIAAVEADELAEVGG